MQKWKLDCMFVALAFFVVACVCGALHLLLTILVFFFTLFVIRRGWRFFFEHSYPHTEGEKTDCVCMWITEGGKINQEG